jgi:hypothetical protein
MAKGGRPPKDPRLLRAIYVSVRFSPAEFQQICLKAGLHKLPVRTYVRETALDHPLPAPMPSLNHATYCELCRIGSNINQLTHLAHMGQSYPGIASALSNLSNLLLSIKSIFRPPRPGRRS